MVGRGGDHGVDALIVEELAHIDVGVDGFLAVGELLLLAVEDGAVGVAEGDDADAGDGAEPLDVVAALASQPDDADADGVVGAAGFGKRHGQGQTGGQRTFENCSSSGVLHDKPLFLLSYPQCGVSFMLPVYHAQLAASSDMVCPGARGYIRNPKAPNWREARRS